jgi:hypothetical protein
MFLVWSRICHATTTLKWRRGQLCAKIDPRPYQTVVDQDRANVSTARAAQDDLGQSCWEDLASKITSKAFNATSAVFFAANVAQTGQYNTVWLSRSWNRATAPQHVHTGLPTIPLICSSISQSYWESTSAAVIQRTQHSIHKGNAEKGDIWRRSSIESKRPSLSASFP